MFLQFDELRFYATSEPFTDDGASQMLVRVSLVDAEGFELEGHKLATSHVDAYDDNADFEYAAQDIAAGLVYDIRARLLEIDALDAAQAALPVTKDLAVNVDYLRLFRNADKPLGGAE